VVAALKEAAEAKEAASEVKEAAEAKEAASEVKEAASEAVVDKEPKEKKAKEEEDSAEVVGAVAKDSKAKKVLKLLELKAEAEEEAEAEVDLRPKVTKSLILEMLVFNTSRERKEWTMLAKMSTSMESLVSNGTHTIEDQAPVEEENSPKEAMARVTGATPKTS